MARKDTKKKALQTIAKEASPPTVAAKEEPRIAQPVAFGLGARHATIALQGSPPLVIADEHGVRQIPAFVAFPVDAEPVAGSDAFAQHFRNLGRTVSDFVPLVGLQSTHPRVLEAAKWSHVAVDCTEELVRYAVGDAFYTPEVLVTMLLRSLAASAESYTGQKVVECVLTHPADFASEQKTALLMAAKSAGLQPISLVAEPVACALAYEHHTRLSGTYWPADLLLVANVGATATTLSVINASFSLYSLIATQTFADLGARRLDLQIFGLFRSEHDLNASAPLINASDDVLDAKLSIPCPRAMTAASARSFARLLDACENARKIVSTKTSASCYVEALSAGEDFLSSLNASRFASLALPWRIQFSVALGEFINSTGLDPAEITSVVLAGGASRTPLVSELLEDFFPSAKTLTGIENDEVAVYGAVLHAAQPTTENAKAAHLSAPLGIVDSRGRFRELIPRFTALPFKVSISLKLPEPASDSLLLTIAEGGDFCPETDDDDFHPLFHPVKLADLALLNCAGALHVDVEVDVSESAFSCAAVARDASTVLAECRV